GRRFSSRDLSPAALAGIVIGGCALAGLSAGAALSSDDEEDRKPVAAESAQPSQSAAVKNASPEASADPVKEQAVALDALLADSNDSRESVIRSVANITACKDLSRAAADLRAAAGQRNDLVTRLSKLSVDKLPQHQQLTAQLNSAWKASASADNHYAAWADQVAGKKGCKGGRARQTGQAAAGNRASGEATAAKQQAAALWNAIAKKYELTERSATQL
ncbi:hypothetical protein C0036_11585, partial [Streptomyces sp. DJ]